MTMEPIAWTMPRWTVNTAALGILLVAAGSFGFGYLGAGHRGRLPGEPAVSATGQPIAAAEYKALNTDPLAGQTPTQQVDDSADEKARREADAKAAAEK